MRASAVSIALSLLLTFPCVAQSEPGEEEARIARVESGLLPPILWKGEERTTSQLTKRMADAGVPGVSVAVIDDFEVAWARGRGMAGVDAGVEVSPNTLFQAGSISKTATAILTLRLVARGVLDLDDPINEHLESWKLPDSEAAGAHPVTIRHLLTHTAGLAPVTYIGVEPGGSIPSVMDLLHGKGQEPPPVIDRIEPPGERYAYSNPGFLILQQLLMDVADESFDDLAHKELFEPLGMTASAFAPVRAAGLSDRLAWGHEPNGDEIESNGLVVPAAVGGLWTTPTDLARLLANALASAGDHSEAYLPGSILEEAMKIEIGSQCLLGAIEGEGESTRLIQTGAMPGFVATLVFYPELGRGAVIMVNSGGRSGTLIREIARSIAVEYAWPGYVDEFERTTVPVDELAELTGTYELDNPPGFRIAVTMSEDRLLWMDREMVAVRGGGFVVPSAGVRIEFVREGDGSVVAVDFAVPGTRMNRARRVE